MELPYGPGEVRVSELKHAMDSERQPICGCPDSYFGWDTVDRVVHKFVTCADCLRLIAQAALEKLRKLGSETPEEEPHDCPTSLCLQAQLSQAQIVNAELQRQRDHLQQELQAKTGNKSVEPPPREKEAVPKPAEPKDDDAATARFRVLDLDD